MTRTDFNELVHKLNRKLYGCAFRFLRNQEDSEDAVQEVFVKLWKLKEKLAGYNSIDALATTMIKNYCIDQIRKQKNNDRLEDSKEFGIQFMTPSPYEQMEIIESHAIIYNIIENMPCNYKDIIKLRDIEGFSFEEIAEQTSQNINTIRVTLSRARRLVRDEYNKFQYEHRGIKQLNRKVL